MNETLHHKVGIVAFMIFMRTDKSTQM